ncbi:2'-5' RNA ligase family protein [Nocardia sp. NPDC050793]|uniref:2'-5' RNA ligase family protein n=1 Tax=Nocardia sp. NPDC050793 TaxID=3155159 RepID=UPI003403C63A
MLEEQQESTISHWWWRPGWSIGKAFYTWHVIPEQPAARGLVAAFASTLAQVATMDPVDAAGLHITVQGIGFIDEVAEVDLERIMKAVRERLAACDPVKIRIGPPIVDRETIQLPIANPDGLRRVRDDIQDAIASVWGRERVPERGNAFRPHLTLAYSTGVTSIPGIRRQLVDAGLADIAVEEEVSAVSLIALNRDHRRYEWTDIGVAELTSSV